MASKTADVLSKGFGTGGNKLDQMLSNPMFNSTAINRVANNNDGNYRPSELLNYLKESPGAIDGLTNEALKEEIKGYIPEKKKLPDDEAKRRYLEGN